MPRVPTYTSGGGAAVFRASGDRTLPGDPLSGFQQGTSNTGAQLSDIAGRLNNQQDELEFAKVRAEYDSALQTTRGAVLTDPNVDNTFMEFNDRAQALQDEYSSRLTRGPVQRAFAKHIAGTFPDVQRDALNDALKRQQYQNVARLNELGDLLSNRGADGTLESRDQAIQDYNDSVNTSERYGTLNAVQASDAKKMFKTTLMTKSMAVLAQKDPTKLFELNAQGAFRDVDPLVHLKTLEEARTKMNADDVKAEANFKKAQHANTQYFEFLALDGAIPDSEMEMMLHGLHPYVTDPKDVERLKKLNDNPITGGGDSKVGAIILDYRSGRPTMDRINAARAELDNYRRNNTKKDKELPKAYKEINDDADSLEAQGRAERGVAAAERQVNIQTAEDVYKSAYKMIMPGFAGQMQKGHQAADLAELRDLIRKNPKGDPRKMAEDILNRRKSGVNNMGQGLKDVMELAK